MAQIELRNLTVVVIDSDFYARNAINAYLAWDRRTRVIGKYARLQEFWQARADEKLRESPAVFVLDANQQGDASRLRAAIEELRQRFADAIVICLAPFADLDFLHAAVDAGAKAYLLKADTRLHIAWAICHAQRLAGDDFLISAAVVKEARKLSQWRLQRAKRLARPREYDGLTERIREAVILYAIEGMSHKLVANEMGISVATVQSYVKEAYRILQDYHDDEGDYPLDMNQQEIAFMRITALDIPRA